jgi:pseudouridine-5'-phosphate glycosidase
MKTGNRVQPLAVAVAATLLAVATVAQVTVEAATAAGVEKVVQVVVMGVQAGAAQAVVVSRPLFNLSGESS